MIPRILFAGLLGIVFWATILHWLMARMAELPEWL